MEIEAPYLQAIQDVDGTTRGEKQMTLNLIARRIAHAKRSHGHSVNSETLISSVPQLLRPLVLVEVANILHQYEGIVEALKSEDMHVVSRALKARWFFDGSDTSLVNVQYLIETLFPEISLFVRSKIVKKFGNYLKNSAFAMNFFTTLAQQYGASQALPLLSACDEDFTSEMIIEKKPILPLKVVKRLYRKYPHLVIKYFLDELENDNLKIVYRRTIRNYIKFFPEIAIKHFEDFTKICLNYHHSSIKAAKKATNIFIESHLDLLLKNPAHYLKFLSLKAITRKLSVDEFIVMFENLFPHHKNSFDFQKLNSHLEYYKPEEDRIPLILDTFRKLYSEDLLECKDLVSSDLMKVLPPADRVKQARLKLDDDKDWHLYDSPRSWRCYLPCSESIPAIIEEIATTSDAWTRSLLLDQLIYTSEINHDKNHFFKALNYIHDRYKTDNKRNLYYGLSVICDSFDLGTFTSTDWEIFKKCMKLVKMEDDFHGERTTLLLIIETALHYNVLNGIPLDDYMNKFVDLNIRLDDYNWNILTKYRNLEKKFLELFIEFLPNQYFVADEILCCKINDIIYSLALAVRKFNCRHRVLDGELEDLSWKNYPWLFGKIKAHILGRNWENDHDRKRFVELIRADERDLYNVWIRDNHEFWTFGVDVILDVLKRQPQRVLDNWKQCMEEVQGTVHSTHESSLFIRKIQWYQELPIKFFNESLKIHNQPEKCTAAMVTLALLTDGETYTKIINPYIPNEEKFDIDNPNAKDIHRMLLAIAADLQKVNPPVSLDVIARFCVGDYLRMAMRSLMSVSRRVPIAKVIPFAKMLTERRVSVMKHGIRLMYLVAPLDKIHKFFINLSNTHSHISIREVIFTKTYGLFLKTPDSVSWLMLQTCLNSLSTDDDDTIFHRLTWLYCTVPDEYYYEYIRTVLKVLESMEQTGEDPKKYISISCKLINSIDNYVTSFLPEEYCQHLIKKYLFVFDYNSAIFDAGMNLTINSYLLASKDYNESRFNFFGEFFRDSVKKYWGKSHPKSSKFYPMNFMARQFFNKFVVHYYQSENLQFSEALLNIFQSALQPHQDAISYMNLAFTIEYRKSVTIVDFATAIVKKMPELIEFFSPDCTSLISRKLSRFFKYHFITHATREENFMDTIEVLVNSGSIYCALIAADMLHSNKYKMFTERHKTVVDILSNSNHLGVSSILNERLATFDFCIPEDDPSKIRPNGIQILRHDGI